MTASRVWPRTTSRPATSRRSTPMSSGPRWRSASSARSTPSTAPARAGSRQIPAMPHMLSVPPHPDRSTAGVHSRRWPTGRCGRSARSARGRGRWPVRGHRAEAASRAMPSSDADLTTRHPAQHRPNRRRRETSLGHRLRRRAPPRRAPAVRGRYAPSATRQAQRPPTCCVDEAGAVHPPHADPPARS